MPRPTSTAALLCHLLRKLPFGLRFTLAQLLRPKLDDMLSREGRADYMYDGLAMESDLTEHVSREMFKLGWYEKPFIDVLAQYANAGDTLLDIGANVGNYSLALRRHYARIFAFEPNPHNADILKNALRANSVLNVDVIELALSDEQKSGLLYVNTSGNAGNASLDSTSIESEKMKSLAIAITTGDQFVLGNAENIAAIKIDVEGAESRVLTGLANTLSRYRPLIQMEWHGPLMQRSEAIPVLGSLLPDYRYFVATSSAKSRMEKIAKRIRTNAIYDRMQQIEPGYEHTHEALFAVPHEKTQRFLHACGE